jgi:hypothetical protein
MENPQFTNDWSFENVLTWMGPVWFAICVGIAIMGILILISILIGKLLKRNRERMERYEKIRNNSRYGKGY